MHKFWSWLGLNLGKHWITVLLVGGDRHRRPRLRHHQARSSRPARATTSTRATRSTRTTSPTRSSSAARPWSRSSRWTRATPSPSCSRAEDISAVDDGRTTKIHDVAPGAQASSRRSPRCSGTTALVRGPERRRDPERRRQDPRWRPRTRDVEDGAARRATRRRSRRSPASPRSRSRSARSTTRVPRLPALRQPAAHDPKPIRTPLLPFFPDARHAQMVVRLLGNESIKDEGKAADS